MTSRHRKLSKWKSSAPSSEEKNITSSAKFLPAAGEKLSGNQPLVLKKRRIGNYYLSTSVHIPLCKKMRFFRSQDLTRVVLGNSGWCRVYIPTAAPERIFFPYTVGSIINRRQYHFNRVQYHLKISSSGKVFNNTGRLSVKKNYEGRVCKSKQGLSRHQNAKHREHKPDQEEVVKKNLSAEDHLHPLYFKKYINNCAKQLATDGCYSDETIDTFSSYNCSLDDANYTYQFVRDVFC